MNRPEQTAAASATVPSLAEDNSALGELAPQVAALRATVGSVIVGKDDVIDLLLTAIVAGGHVLVEDVPGVGKTTLAHAVAAALGCSFHRIQFTSDLLPSDILGVTVYDRDRSEFTFRPGPIFANVILADEINRTTPKTQSALLEAMSHGRVHIDGKPRELPQPFHVIATQNPMEHHGTYPLPESQMDRFLMRLTVGYPGREEERRVMQTATADPDRLASVVGPAELLALQQRARTVQLHASIEDYILTIVEATRRSRKLLLGVSPRGTQALTRAVQARALLDGRDYAVPDDVKELANSVLAHRVLAAGGPDPLGHARPAAEIIAEIIETLPPPA